MFGSGSHYWQQKFTGLNISHGVELHQEGENIEVAFQPLPLADIMATVKVVYDEPGAMPSKEPI